MSRSLFEKYGGFASISKVVFAFYEKAIESDVIGPYFEDSDMRALVVHQTKFISSVMGGPASYSDEALRRVHASLNIDRAAFEEMSRLLRETLVEFELDSEDIETVMHEIDSRTDIIVTRPGA